jgi:L-lactate dehydrogenase
LINCLFLTPPQVAWSIATIGGIPLALALPTTPAIDRASLAARCVHRAADIIAAKGATSFGIGSVTATICASILRDKHDVRPVSCFHPQLGCCLSLPVVLGRRGVVRRLEVPLDEGEEAALRASAERLSMALAEIKITGEK